MYNRDNVILIRIWDTEIESLVRKIINTNLVYIDTTVGCFVDLPISINSYEVIQHINGLYGSTASLHFRDFVLTQNLEIKKNRKRRINDVIV